MSAPPADCARILIIEDDADIRLALRGVLEGEGFRVVEAEHGQAALTELQRRGPPCLVFLDLMMPVMNGWDFLDTMRQNWPALHQLPVVVISGYLGVHASRPLAHGLVALLQKPPSLDSILHFARRYCPST